MIYNLYFFLHIYNFHKKKNFHNLILNINDHIINSKFNIIMQSCNI